MLLVFYPYNCTLFSFFFPPKKQHTGQTYQVPLVRSYHFRKEFAICTTTALGWDHEFLTSLGLAFEQNLRGGGGNERENERESKRMKKKSKINQKQLSW